MPRTSAVSGIMLPALPAWTEPMVTTPNFAASFSRLITLCTSTTKWAGHHHRIDRDVWARAVAALALEDDRQPVGRRVDDAGLEGHGAERPGTDMQGEAVVGLAEAREQAVGQHRLGAAAALFRRLADEHQACRSIGPSCRAWSWRRRPRPTCGYRGRRNARPAIRRRDTSAWPCWRRAGRSSRASAARRARCAP